MWDKMISVKTAYVAFLQNNMTYMSTMVSFAVIAIMPVLFFGLNPMVALFCLGCGVFSGVSAMAFNVSEQ